MHFIIIFFEIVLLVVCLKEKCSLEIIVRWYVRRVEKISESVLGWTFGFPNGFSDFYSMKLGRTLVLRYAGAFCAKTSRH